MKNFIKIISILILGVFIVSSCMKKADDIFHSPDGANAYLQFTTLNGVYAMTPADTLAYDIEFGVKVLGDAPTSDLSVAFDIVSNTVNLDSQVVLNSSVIVIPANHYTGSITMTVDPNKFELSADTLKLSLKLSDSNGDVAEYGNEATFNFIYNVCPFDILDFLGGFTCNEAGYGEYAVNFSLDPDVPNRIWNNNFWDWAAAGALLSYDFSGDANQTITIEDQPFEFGDGTVGSVVGSGTYDACTGKFSCDYVVTYAGSDYPTHHDFYRGGGKNLPTIPVKKALFVK